MAVIDNLVSYWALDEAAGANAVDSHGTNTLTDRTGALGTTTGKVGSARDFTLSRDLFIADNATLSVTDQDFSFQAWVYSTNLSGNRVILGKWASPTYEFILDYVPTATDRFRFSPNSNADSVYANNLGSPSINTWYHIVAWHESGTGQFGIVVNNGTADTAARAVAPADGTSPFAIGSYDGAGSNPWEGRIDEVAFWKRKLSSADIAWLYNSGAGRSYADLVAESTGGSVAWLPVVQTVQGKSWSAVDSGMVPPEN